MRSFLPLFYGSKHSLSLLQVSDSHPSEIYSHCRYLPCLLIWSNTVAGCFFQSVGVEGSEILVGLAWGWVSRYSCGVCYAWLHWICSGAGVNNMPVSSVVFTYVGACGWGEISGEVLCVGLGFLCPGVWRWRVWLTGFCAGGGMHVHLYDDRLVLFHFIWLDVKL